MKLNSLKDLYVHELVDLRDAEQRLCAVLLEMVEKATAPNLTTAIHAYQKDCNRRLEALEKLFNELQVSPDGEVCEAMRGLVRESRAMVNATGDEATINAALIGCCNRMQHYMMAGYGCARTYARLLGFDEHAEELQRSLEEHGTENRSFTTLAEHLNLQSVGT